MPLYLTAEQEMLADTVRPFLAEVAPVSHMRALRDTGDTAGLSRSLWKRFAEMGFTGVLAPEGSGGLGLGHVEAGIILEEIGRNLTPSPFLSTAVGMVTALSHGADAQRERFLPAIMAGELIAALAFDETSAHRPERLTMVASRQGDSFTLNGRKQFVVQGNVADIFLVSARTSGEAGDAEGVTVFAVSREAAGVTIKSERLVDSSISSRIDFEGVTLNKDAVVGEVEHGRAIVDATLMAVRAGAASELLGAGCSAADLTLGYLKARKQFGRLIGTYQALQHRSAHLYSELEIARAAVLRAQHLLDAHSEAADQAVSVAKATSGLASSLAVKEAIQMHGGIGMTDEYDVGFYMKRQRVLAEMFGDSDYHADRIARMAGY